MIVEANHRAWEYNETYYLASRGGGFILLSIVDFDPREDIRHGFYHYFPNRYFIPGEPGILWTGEVNTQGTREFVWDQVMTCPERFFITEIL